MTFGVVFNALTIPSVSSVHRSSVELDPMDAVVRSFDDPTFRTDGISREIPGTNAAMSRPSPKSKQSHWNRRMRPHSLHGCDVNDRPIGDVTVLFLGQESDPSSSKLGVQAGIEIADAAAEKNCRLQS
jgi:hypothetical protein